MAEKTRVLNAGVAMACLKVYRAFDGGGQRPPG